MRDSSSGISILCAVLEVLLLKPFLLFLVLRYVDALYLEDDRACAVVAAGYHHALIVGPAVHDVAALQGGIDIATHSIPRLTTEPAVHQMVEVVLLRRTVKDERIARLEARTWSRLGVGKILLLELWKHLGFENSYFALMPHVD